MNIFKALFFLLGTFLVLEAVFFINSWLYGQLKPFCSFDKSSYQSTPAAASDSPNAELEEAVKLAVEEVVAKAVQEGLEKAVSKAVVEGIADVTPQAIPGGSSNAEMKVMECQKLKEELAACDGIEEEIPEGELPVGEEGAEVVEGDAVVEERTEEENAELIEQAEQNFEETRAEEAEKEAESLAEAEQQLAETEQQSAEAEEMKEGDEATASDESVVSVEALNEGAEETLAEGEEGEPAVDGEPPKEGELAEGKPVAAAA